jgi:DNA/RNA-binding domain of Phe-tRNA-synthetase-like protein
MSADRIDALLAPGGLTIEDDLKGVVTLAVLGAAPVLVAPSGPSLLHQVATTVETLAREHAGKPPAAIEGLRRARDLYRAFGIDPTRTRPSSEALLRRILQGKGMPRILNAVDVCNLCAVRFLLSIGLYDAGAIRGRVLLRRGRSGEAYEGIRKDEVHLEGRPALCDEAGPFGNPTSDSGRTMVTEETRAILMVIFAPAGFERTRLETHARHARELMEAHLSGPGIPVRTAAVLIPSRSCGSPT